MVDALPVIVLAVAFAAVIYYLVRKGTVLVINAVVGLLALFLLNIFEVMSMAGAPEIPITAATVIICAFGGLPGAIILALLHLIGITL